MYGLSRQQGNEACLWIDYAWSLDDYKRINIFGTQWRCKHGSSADAQSMWYSGTFVWATQALKSVYMSCIANASWCHVIPNMNWECASRIKICNCPCLHHSNYMITRWLCWLSSSTSTAVWPTVKIVLAITLRSMLTLLPYALAILILSR